MGALTETSNWTTAAIALFALGCSASGDDGSRVMGVGSNGPATGDGQTDQLGGGTNDGPGLSVDQGGGLGSTPNGMSDIGGCGGDSYVGEPGRLDMYVMMDRSGSMIFPFDLWSPIGTALGEFVIRPEAAGIGVGIQFFENAGGSCNAADYAVPAAPINLLPQNADAIRGAISANGPLFGGTPTLPALEGALQHAAGHASASGTKTIVVLATDGQPEECGSDVANVSAAAAAGLGGAPSIATYVIGIGDVAALNQIAQAGGTGQAFIVPADPALATDQFLLAMNQIRGAALPCDYGIPAEADDPGLVNVEFTGGGAPEVIPNVGDVAGCGGGGWYFDNAAAPNRIHACPEECTRFNSGGAASINVIVGCPTVVLR